MLAYLQLARLPNVFTALADVAMGYLVTHGAVQVADAGYFALLLIASACFYTAGMVLNDVFDVDIDRRERPGRPIPSGRISLHTAARLGWWLWRGGLLAVIIVALLTNDWRPAVVGGGLAILIVAYNAWLKHTPLGPLAMGGCRALNVLLGMSLSPEPWSTLVYLIAAGLGIYVAGITWFARSEAETSGRWQLLLGLLVMWCGMALLWWYPQWLPAESLTPALQMQGGDWSPRTSPWTLLWLLLALSIGWRASRAFAEPSSHTVQATVKTCILSIIVFDAVTTFAVAGPLVAMCVLLLLVPTVALGAWVYST